MLSLLKLGGNILAATTAPSMYPGFWRQFLNQIYNLSFNNGFYTDVRCFHAP
jgi:hypothetical protein